MDLWSAILTCSLYPQGEPLVRAIAQSSPEGNVLSVIEAAASVDDLSPPGRPATVDQALARVDAIGAKGGRPRLGWMQVSPEWVKAFGRPLRDAFDPCINVSIGTAMLSAFDYECEGEAVARAGQARGRSAPGRTGETPFSGRERCVLRKYGEALGIRDFESITMLELRFQRSADDGGLAGAPIFAEKPGRGTCTWGSDCIFVPVTAGW
jgi:hypothetical protein